MKQVFVMLALAGALAARGDSCDVSNVAWQQVENGRVDITYDLGGRVGFVAVDILKDGVSVADKGSLTGDANTFVTVGAGKRAVWRITDEAFATSRPPAGSFSVKVSASPIPLDRDYLAIDLATGAATCYANAAAVPGGVGDARWKTSHALFRRIPAAGKTSVLGKLVGECKQADRNNTGTTQLAPHAVSFDDDYYVAIYETTLGQYITLAGAAPGGYRFGQSAYSGKSHDATHQTDYLWHPVSNVTPVDAEATATTLTSRFNAANGTAFAFALPSEDEWEYACRCDCPRDLYMGYYGRPNNIWGYTWNGHTVTFQGATQFYGDGGKATYADSKPVGTGAASPWGLFDMLGNVNEFTVAQGGSGSMARGGSAVMSGETHIASYREKTYSTTSNYCYGYRLICRPR